MILPLLLAAAAGAAPLDGPRDSLSLGANLSFDGRAGLAPGEGFILTSAVTSVRGVPQTPSRMTNAHRAELERILSGQPRADGRGPVGATGLPAPFRARVRDALRDYDENRADGRLSAGEWDRRLAIMRQSYATRLPRGRSFSRLEWSERISDVVDDFVRIEGDRITRFESPSEAQRTRERAGNLESSTVGLALTAVQGGLSVTHICPGSSARGPMRRGDIVTAVGSADVRRLPPYEAESLLRGRAGTSVRVHFQRQGRPYYADLVRAELNPPEVFEHSYGAIGYVYLASFVDGSDRMVLDALQRLRGRGARAFVLDLRGDGGGNTFMAAQIASEFLPDGRLIATLAGRRQTTAYRSRGAGRFLGAPLAILVDRNSASASELLTVALQAHGAAQVVGEPTFGKGTFQAPIPVEIPPGWFYAGGRDGSRGYYREGRWYGPQDESVLEGINPLTGARETRGADPDIAVPISDRQREESVTGLRCRLYQEDCAPSAPDPVLSRALEVLAARTAGS